MVEDPSENIYRKIDLVKVILHLNSLKEFQLLGYKMLSKRSCTTVMWDRKFCESENLKVFAEK